MVCETGQTARQPPDALPAHVTPSYLYVLLINCEQHVGDNQVAEHLGAGEYSMIIASLGLPLLLLLLYFPPPESAFNYWKLDLNGLTRAASQRNRSLPKD